MILIISAVSKFLLEIHLFLCFKHSLKLQVSNVFSKKKMVLRPSPSLRKSRCLTIADRAIAIFEIIAKLTSLSGLFLAVLISDCLTGLILKPALILTKSLTRDPYNRGFLKKRKSVILVPRLCVRTVAPR